MGRFIHVIGTMTEEVERRSVLFLVVYTYGVYIHHFNFILIRPSMEKAA